MAETMVERVARAIYRDRFGSEPDEDRWLDESEQRREDYRGHARAAIAAMREPDEKMIDPLWSRRLEDWGVEFGAECYANIWRAMIDAALAPTLQDEERG